jgi:hypothetical protein
VHAWASLERRVAIILLATLPSIMQPAAGGAGSKRTQGEAGFSRTP